MAGTFSKIYLQIVFHVRGSGKSLTREQREEVYKYISGIITEKGHKSIIVNGVHNHIHVFLGFRPAGAISDLVRDIKNNSSKFINEKKWLKDRFAWQEGYGVFSYGSSQINNVYN